MSSSRKLKYAATFVLFSLSFVVGCQKAAVLTPDQAKQNPREALLAAMSRMRDGKSYRIENTSMTGSSSLEYLAPDRFHHLFNKLKSERIAVGKTFYDREDGSAWKKRDALTDEPGGSLSKYHRKDAWDEAVKKADVTLVGEESLDGVKCVVFEYVIPAPVAPLYKGNPKHKTWIAVDNGLPHKTIIEGASMPLGTLEKEVITYSNFSGNLKIEPPI